MLPFTQKIYFDSLSSPDELDRGTLKLFVKENALIFLLYNEFSELKLCKAIYNSQELTLSLFLRFVFEKETLLYHRDKFNIREVISSSTMFTLIPDAILSPRDSYHYANILMGESIYDDEVFSRPIADSNIQTIFISPPHLHYILEEYLEEYQLTHISGYDYHVAKKLSSLTPTHLLIHMYDEVALITAFKSGKLYLSNCYEYRTSAGILYFIQSVKKMLDGDDMLNIYLIGDTTEDASWVQQMKEKLPNAKIPAVDFFGYLPALRDPSYWEFAFLI